MVRCRIYPGVVTPHWWLCSPHWWTTRPRCSAASTLTGECGTPTSTLTSECGTWMPYLFSGGIAYSTFPRRGRVFNVFSRASADDASFTQFQFYLSCSSPVWPASARFGRPESGFWRVSPSGCLRFRLYFLSRSRTDRTQTLRSSLWLLGPYQGVRHQGEVFRRKPPSWRHRDFVLPSSVVIIDDGDSSEYSVPIVSIGPSVASVGRIADFLLYLFRLVREINSLRGYRLVIAAIHSGFSRWGLHFGFGLLLSPVQGNVLGTVHGTNLGSPVEVFLGLRDPRGASFRARCSLER